MVPDEVIIRLPIFIITITVVLVRSLNLELRTVLLKGFDTELKLAEDDHSKG